MRSGQLFLSLLYSVATLIYNLYLQCCNFVFFGLIQVLFFCLSQKNPLNEISYKSSLQKEIKSNLKKYLYKRLRLVNAASGETTSLNRASCGALWVGLLWFLSRRIISNSLT